MKLLIFGYGKNVFRLSDRLVDANYKILCLVPPTEQKTFVLGETRKYGCTKIKIPLIRTNNINSLEFIRKIRNLKCDLLVNFFHNKKLSSNLIKTSRLGVVHMHKANNRIMSKNPKYQEQWVGAEFGNSWKVVYGQTFHFQSRKIKNKTHKNENFVDKNNSYEYMEKVFQKTAEAFYFEAINKIKNHEQFDIFDPQNIEI